MDPLLKMLLHSLVFSVVGVVVLGVCFWIMEKATPENLWEEILVKQNKALAIIMGALVLGISLIIAASIHG
jgi:uncharacterized membrane protein YjfL (UPF0719 family)